MLVVVVLRCVGHYRLVRPHAHLCVAKHILDGLLVRRHAVPRVESPSRPPSTSGRPGDCQNLLVADFGLLEGRRRNTAYGACRFCAVECRAAGSWQLCCSGMAAG